MYILFQKFVIETKKLIKNIRVFMEKHVVILLKFYDLVSYQSEI